MLHMLGKVEPGAWQLCSGSLVMYQLSFSFRCTTHQMCWECSFFCFNYQCKGRGTPILSLFQTFAMQSVVLVGNSWKQKSPVFKSTHLHLYKYHNTSVYSISLELFTFRSILRLHEKIIKKKAMLLYARTLKISLIIFNLCIYSIFNLCMQRRFPCNTLFISFLFPYLFIFYFTFLQLIDINLAVIWDRIPSLRSSTNKSKIFSQTSFIANKVFCIIFLVNIMLVCIELCNVPLFSNVFEL